MRQIAANAGAEGSIVVDKVKHGKGGLGFNAAPWRTRIWSRPAPSAGTTRPTSMQPDRDMPRALSNASPRPGRAGRPPGVATATEESQEHRVFRSARRRLHVALDGDVAAMAAVSSGSLRGARERTRDREGAA